MMIVIRPTPDTRNKLNSTFEGISQILNLGHRELEKIADAGRRGIALNFATESAGGEKWAPLAPWTVAERRALGFAGEHLILQRTTSLKRSLVEPSHPLNITEVSTHGFYGQLTRILIELGSADERFPILHAGGISNEGYYIPPRPMTVLGTESIRQLETSIIFVIEERWKRLGHR